MLGKSVTEKIFPGIKELEKNFGIKIAAMTTVKFNSNGIVESSETIEFNK